VPDPFVPGERVYRTGDLARRLPDGTAEYLGRATTRSNCAASGSNRARSRPRCWPYPGCGRRSYWPTATRPAHPPDRRHRPRRHPRTLPHEWRAALGAAAGLHDPLALRRVARPAAEPQRQARPGRPAAAGAETAPVQVNTASPRDRIETDAVRDMARHAAAPDIGVRDNFFDLGRHRCRPSRWRTPSARHSASPCPVRDIMLHPTIEALAAGASATGQLRPTAEQPDRVPARRRPRAGRLRPPGGRHRLLLPVPGQGELPEDVGLYGVSRPG
jgi:hypothetical protein